MHPRIRLLALAIGTLLVLASLPATSQRRGGPPPMRRMPYCNIIAVESQRLGNAVQVTIRADGLMRLNYNVETYYDSAAAQRGVADPRKPVMEIPFRITNARSQVNSFTDVGVYPVSHVETSLPTDTPDGLGVDIKLVLFNRGVVRSLRIEGEEQDFSGIPYPGPTFSVRLTQDQRSLIILVTSDQRTLAPVQRLKPGEAQPSEMSVEVEGDSVTIYALNTDLRELMREFTRQTGIVVMVDPDLERVASMCLQEIPAEEALQAIANGYGLQLGRANGTWVLGEGGVGNVNTYLASAIEKIPLSYISAVSARNSLPEFLLKHLRVNASDNSLTVVGSPALVQKVRQDLSRIDRPLPHVRIEAIIVELSDAIDSEQLLRLMVKDAHQTMRVNIGTGDITYQKLGAARTDLQAQLRALEVQDKVRIRAIPFAIALNGQKARIFSGQHRYIKADYYDPGLNALFTRVLPVNVGISLEMSCWVGAEGFILANVAPEVTAVAEIDFATGLPTVSTRRAETTMLLRDGETLFIGGLKLRQRDSLTHRIPLLGDLPLIGGLFRVKDSRESSTELALFVTPRLIIQPAEVSDNS